MYFKTLKGNLHWKQRFWDKILLAKQSGGQAVMAFP